MLSGMDIQKAKTKDIIDIVNLLNDATQKLLKKEVMQWKYPWSSKPVESDIKNGYQYCIKENQSIIAVFSLKSLPINPWTEEINESQMYLYRIAVAPSCQGRSIGLYLCHWIEEYALLYGKVFYLDCWNGNNKLKTFYLNAGFYRIGDFPEKDYFISVFRYDGQNPVDLTV